MDIQDIKAKKKELDKSIGELVRAFEKETNMNIDSVQVNSILVGDLPPMEYKEVFTIASFR